MNTTTNVERKNKVCPSTIKGVESSFSKNLKTDSIHERMMSVYPASKGFGFLILENTENIIH